MSLFKSRIPVWKIIGALLSLTCFAGALHANVLTATSPITLTCNTATGPGTAVNVIVKPVTSLTGSNTIVVSVGTAGAGLVVTPPSVTTLSTANQSAGITYVVNLAAGCSGSSSGTSHPTLQFDAGGVADVSPTVNATVTVATSSTLVASGTSVTCGKNGSTYTPGAPRTILVTSTTTGGTPFTVDTVTNPPPAWLNVTPTSGGTATSSAVVLTVTVAAGCGGFAAGSTNTATLHLLNSPAPDKLVTVTLQVFNSSPLTATPSSGSITYVKGSGSPGHVDINVTSAASPAPYFTVDTTTLPAWLTVDSTSGTVPKSIRFSSTVVADSMIPGLYQATVFLHVSGYGDLPLPISLQLNNAASKLTAAEGITRNISWTIGQNPPTPFITLVSSDAPIAYSITTSGTLAPTVPSDLQQGLAYNFGTEIPVSFSSAVFAAAVPGQILNGTVSISWGTPTSTLVVTFNITVQSPGATLISISPASLPTATSGQVFTVAISGTGFIPSTDPTQRTKVGIVVSGAMVSDTSFAVNVVNPSNILLTITVPATADPNLPFGSGGTVTLGVCNPISGSCTAATGTATLTISANPIIQAVTSGSTFVQSATPNIATYDIISIFGIDFCSSGGTGCSTTTVLYGTVNPVTLTYNTSVSPDPAGATQRSLTVTFQTHGGSPTVIGNAPVLFATNSQINALVPSGFAAQIGGPVDTVVNFGYGTGTTMKSSSPFTVNAVATDPGIFTIGADGEGSGAILNSSGVPIGSSNPGGMRTTATDSDIVEVYLSGLGVPDSTAANSSGGGLSWSADCVSIANFLASLNAAASSTLTSLDGSIIQSALLDPSRLPPCIQATSTIVPTATVGGVNAPVKYAGWVPDSVAGLYQVNIQLPGSTAGPFTTVAGTSVGSITAPVQLPIVVTSNGVSSQANVTLWVTQRLKVTGPSGAGLSGTVGVPWSGSNNSVTATEGTSPYRYALTSGVLPSGLTLNSGTGAITGTPAARTAGSYVVTVTATDSASTPVTGSVTFTLNVAGGLVMNSSNTPPFNSTFGTANASVTTITATGGTTPYTYAITAPASLPTGMTINSSTGVVGITAATPGGTYHVTVTATDSTSGTALTGSINFDIVIALNVTHGTITNPAPGGGAVTTVSATGNTGTVSFSVDATSAANGISIDSSGNLSSSGTTPTGSHTVTVTATDSTTATGSSVAATGTVAVTFTQN